MLLERGALHFKDVLADPDVPPSIRAIADQLGIGSYSQVFVPMVWKGQTIGTLYVTRQPPTGFSDKEVALLRTFADQAVIAIQNSRLFNETKEALERQTATAEVLRVISGSVTETQPVFDVIAERAVRLMGANLGFVFRFDGDSIHIASVHGVSPEGLDAARKAFPMPPATGRPPPAPCATVWWSTSATFSRTPTSATRPSTWPGPPATAPCWPCRCCASARSSARSR